MPHVLTIMFATVLLLATVMSLRPVSVEAKPVKVTSCSKLNGSRCLSGPVRNTPLGQQVRLPGGTWVWCAGDCQDQLRMETVDFWYEQMLRN